MSIRKRGRIHTSFNQAVAATGRLSSNNPNLQNIPVRDERGREIRKAFVPEKGHIFFSADYSQIELRLMAHLSKDKSMIDDFLSGNDIHAATAAKIFGVEIGMSQERCEAGQRQQTLGSSTGSHLTDFQKDLQLAEKRPKSLSTAISILIPGLKVYMDESIKKGQGSRICNNNVWTQKISA